MPINFSLPGYELVHKARQKLSELIATVRHDVRRMRKQTTTLERALYGLNEYQILGPLQGIAKSRLNRKTPFLQLSNEEKRLVIVALQKHRWSRGQLEEIITNLPLPPEGIPK